MHPLSRQAISEADEALEQRQILVDRPVGLEVRVGGIAGFYVLSSYPLAVRWVLVLASLGVGIVESLLARLAFRRVPLLLTVAFLLCLFALLGAWKGDLS